MLGVRGIRSRYFYSRGGGGGVVKAKEGVAGRLISVH